jgi:DNA-binding MarR family transcriptional regulator
MHNAFFKPTQLYKEYMILDMIEKNSKITQREMADFIGVAVSMINQHLDVYETKGLIQRKKHSTKIVDYYITKKGLERRKLLNICYLKSTHEVYLSAKDNIVNFLNGIIKKGYKKILLYGAGDVASIMLQTIQNESLLPIEIVGVIDDDIYKIGNKIINKEIIPLSAINNYKHDAILIASYTHQETMSKKLKSINYDKHKILNFF